MTLWSRADLHWVEQATPCLTSPWRRRYSLIALTQGWLLVTRTRKSVKLALPEPKALKVIGEKSRYKGKDELTSREIDRIIKAAREFRRD